MITPEERLVHLRNVVYAHLGTDDPAKVVRWIVEARQVLNAWTESPESRGLSAGQLSDIRLAGLVRNMFNLVREDGENAAIAALSRAVACYHRTAKTAYLDTDGETGRLQAASEQQDRREKELYDACSRWQCQVQECNLTINILRAENKLLHDVDRWAREYLAHEDSPMGDVNDQTHALQQLRAALRAR